MTSHHNKPIKKVFVAHKNSVYQRYILNEQNKNIHALIKKNHPMTRYILTSHEAHLKAIEKVEQTLTKLGVKHKISQRTHIKSLKGYDLIITIGGDGTLFRTCHYVEDQPVLGINSAPKTSVGALCSLDIIKFEKRIADILEGRYSIRKLLRMQVKLNKKPLPIESINDLLFTSSSPAATSSYMIALGRIKEEQKSSGIWIATPAGSTAAISAAGGMKQHHQSSRLQYLTREPYQGIFNPYRLTRGFIKKDASLKITSKMIKSRLFFDGPTKFVTLEYGDQISISQSKNVLKLVEV